MIGPAPDAVLEAGVPRAARRLDGAPNERPRLFSLPTIIGFGLAVALGLLLVYPHKTLEQQLLRTGSEKTDRLTVEYLKVFLKAEPRASGLRLALAAQLVDFGEFQEARQTLQPTAMPLDQAWQVGAAWLELTMRNQEAFAVAEDDDRHQLLLKRTQTQMRLLVKMPLDIGKMITLGRMALAANTPDVAVEAFRQVAANPTRLSTAVYAEAAGVSLGLREYRTGAALYFRSMAQSTLLDMQRQYFIAGLQALQAASLFDEAMVATEEHIGPLAEDTQTLLFLTRLAQACNRPEIAQRYARRLLRLSMLRRIDQVGLQLARHQFSVPRVQVRESNFGMPRLMLIDTKTAINGIADKPLLPFDEEVYLLAFQVFLANNNLVEARTLAQSAVRQQPKSASWHKRLAEVSEWSGAAQEALTEWLLYARLGNDEKGWDAALRLAQSLFDQPALIVILQHKLAVDGGNPKWMDQLLASYEAAGEPEHALALLQARLFAGNVGNGLVRGTQRRHELELLAEIAERSGADNLSLDAYRRLQQQFGPNTRYASRIANHLFRHGKITDAFAALQHAVMVASAKDGDFWRTYAEVGRMLENDTAAQAGYRKLLEGNQQTENDLTNLIAVLETPQPRAAAAVAAFSYTATRKPEFAVQALNLYARTTAWPQARNFLASIPAALLPELEKRVLFLSARAAVLQATADLPGAAHDVRQALSLEPENADLRASLIWILIATRDTPALQHALQLWRADAEADASLWGPFAAAQMALNQPADALHWFKRSGFMPDDYLWLMSYAECLEANAQTDMAWRIRRHVWVNLRNPRVLSNANPEFLLELRDRLAASAPLFLNGDGSQRMIQELLQADAAMLRQQQTPVLDQPQDGSGMLTRLQAFDALPPSPLEQAQREGTTLQALFRSGSGNTVVNPPANSLRLSASVRELALSYALSHEANELARAWLASRYATQLSRPVWAELSLVLANDDRQRLNQLLDQVPDWLPAYDRIEAAQRAGRPALAQSFAFQQLVQVNADDEAHLRLKNLVTEDPAAFHFDMLQARYFPLRVDQVTAENTIALSTGLRLSLALSGRRQRNDNKAELGVVPGHDNDAEIALRQRTETGYVMASLQARSAAENTVGARLNYSFMPWPALTISGTAGLHQRATESALLRAGGMRSGIENDIIYAFSKREYMRAGFGWQQYASQAGTQLGTGQSWNIEAGSHLRLDYPNLTLRAFASGSSFSTNGRHDGQIAQLVPSQSDPLTFSYMPAGSTTVGISAGFGTVIDNSYSRAWRPFLELGLTRDSNEGRGYSISAGIGGSVFGQDMLLVRGQRSSATSGNPQGEQEIGVNYRWFY
jgi:polysaccharide biosynthesis protein PelB